LVSLGTSMHRNEKLLTMRTLEMAFRNLPTTLRLAVTIAGDYSIFFRNNLNEITASAQAPAEFNNFIIGQNSSCFDLKTIFHPIWFTNFANMMRARQVHENIE